MLGVPARRAPTERDRCATSIPATGGAVMSTLDCYADAAAKGQCETRPKRATYNMICLVVSGQGRSTVGDHSFRLVAERRVHDAVMVLGQPRSHSAATPTCSSSPTRSAFERLDVLREELQ